MTVPGPVERAYMHLCERCLANTRAAFKRAHERYVETGEPPKLTIESAHFECREHLVTIVTYELSLLGMRVEAPDVE